MSNSAMYQYVDSLASGVARGSKQARVSSTSSPGVGVGMAWRSALVAGLELLGSDKALTQGGETQQLCALQAGRACVCVCVRASP